MKYMLMFCRNDGAGPAFEEMTPEAQADLGGQIGRWHADNAARIVDRGHRLAPAAMATTVRRKETGALVTDGPFVEANEVIAGYVIADVPDLDEALHMAKTFPACSTVEIRPLADQP